MAKGVNQKLKLLYLMDILLEKTDENHGITMNEIISSLESYDVSAERKSIYRDIEELQRYGLDVLSYNNGRTTYYHVASRLFEIAELKLLVDAVQSSKFITEKKSRELIKKLESFASKYQAQDLQRQVYVQGRVKTMNESIYYNVDKIHHAIERNHSITFQYYQWNVKKQMELKHEGERYEISPWQLMWDDENYYLIGFDHKARYIKHFRVDKMLDIQMCDHEREGEETFEKVDAGTYSKKVFGMYDGTETAVKLKCRNSLVGVMIDRFGKNVPLIPLDDEYFQVNVTVAVSQQFIGWLMAIGTGVTVIEPEEVREKVIVACGEMLASYAQ
ncbi:putative uncharacterized protein [Roseburia sp. CAG:309]|nr:putative uncharacterized protein [Roseburia sp. CAG:309]